MLYKVVSVYTCLKFSQYLTYTQVELTNSQSNIVFDKPHHLHNFFRRLVEVSLSKKVYHSNVLLDLLVTGTARGKFGGCFFKDSFRECARNCVKLIKDVHFQVSGMPRNHSCDFLPILTNAIDSGLKGTQTAAARRVIVHAKSGKRVHQRVEVTSAMLTVSVSNAHLAEKPFSLALLIQTEITDWKSAMLLLQTKHSFRVHNKPIAFPRINEETI